MKWLSGLCGLVVSLYAEVVLASAEAHPSINWWHLGPEYKDAPALGWLSITFAIFVYGVSRAVKKPLALYLETRSRDIARQIEEGRLAKLESENKLRLYDEKLKSVTDEIQKLKDSFAEQARAERLERERLAAELAARILRDADETIRANLQRSKNRLAHEVIAQAVTQAEEQIAKKQRDQIDDLMKENFLHDLKTTNLGIKRDEPKEEFIKSSFVREFGASAGEVH